MGLSIKGILKGAKNVVNAVNPVSHAIYGAVGGKSPTAIGKDFLTDSGRAAAGAGVLGAGYLAMPTVGALGGAAGAAGGAGAAGAAGSGMTAGLGGFGVGSMLGSVGSYILGHPELILGGIGALQSANAAKNASGLQNQAIDLARQRYNDMAPLRSLGMERVQDAINHPVTPLQAVGGYQDMGNPYTVAYQNNTPPASPAARIGASPGGAFFGAPMAGPGQPVPPNALPSALPMVGTLGGGRATGKMNRAVRRAGGML